MLELLIQLFFLIISLLTLSFASKIALESAEKLASYFGFSKLAIGFILISVLTSLPEFSVAIISASSNNNNLSLGNLLGANIVNISLVFGAFLFFSKDGFSISRKRWNQIVLYLLISLVPVVLFIDSSLSFSDGLVLLVLYLLFVKLLLDSREKSVTIEEIDKKKAAKEFLFLLGSLFLILISAEFVVKIAVQIANEYGLFQSFIGATIISLGTTIPELTLTLMAIKKRLTDIAIGNLIGSNVVNITLLLGLNVLINPFIPNIEVSSIAFSFIFLSSGYLVYKFLTKGVLNRNDGLLLFTFYILYVLAVSSLQLVSVIQ